MSNIAALTRNQARTSPILTEARTKMSKNQLKAFYQCITLLQMTDENFLDTTISAKEFADKIGISTTNDDLQKLCRSLVRVTWEIETKEIWQIFTIFSTFKLDKKKDEVYFKFNNDMKPFLLNLKKYTKIQQVKYIMSFNSEYAIRIYALLKDYRKMTYRDFNLEALFKIFELKKGYKKSYTDFYKRVLQPAIREINAKSDLFVTEPEIIGKNGKKITNIRLYFGNKNEQIGLDFVNELIKRYKRYKSFNVFANCYYLRSPELKNIRNDIARIKRISTDRNTYFQAFSSDEYGNEICLIGTPNKDDFVNYLANGIYKAVSALCEIEKQETLPIFQWQEQKRLKRIKAMVAEWQNNPTKIFYNCALQY